MRLGLTPAGPHNAECRTRLSEHLAKTDAGQARVSAAAERLPDPAGVFDPGAAGAIRHTLKRPRLRAEGETTLHPVRLPQSEPSLSSSNSPQLDDIDGSAEKRRVVVVDPQDQGNAGASSSGLTEAERAQLDLRDVIARMPPDGAPSPPTENDDTPMDGETTPRLRINCDTNGNSIQARTDDAMDNLDTDNIDISEVYSPPRITASANDSWLRGGWALDLSTNWDLSNPEQQKLAMDLRRKTKPKMLIASPPCTWFCSLMRWNWKKMPPEKVQDEMTKAIIHLSFAAAMCEEQHREGRLFLFEHPARTSSWRLDILNDLRNPPGVISVLADMCGHGMGAEDKLGTGAVKKTIRSLANSKFVAAAVGVRCPKNHRHVTLVDGRPKAAGEFPKGLCDAICRGCKDHMNEVRARTAHHRPPEAEAPPQTSGDTPQIYGDINLVTMELEENIELAICEEAAGESMWEASDDVNGGPLDPKDVLKARVLEMQYMRKRGVYKVVARAEAMRAAGKVINTMWIGSNRGDDENINSRSRFVAKEFRGPGHVPIFAGTPPLESLRALIRMRVAHQTGPMDQRWGMICIDVSRAYFYALAVRRVFVKLPAEDPASSEPNAVGELQMSMYGTQDAAANWEAAYRETLIKGNFKQGLASSCHYLHADGTTPLMVRRDDFIATGTRAEFDRLRKVLEAEYEVKSQTCGPWVDTDKSMRVLGRVISSTSEGIGYEADPRDIEAAIAAYDLQDCKSISTPWAADPKTEHGDLNLRRCMAETHRSEEVLWKEHEESETVEFDRMNTFQSVAARLNYLCLDRTDVQFAVKEMMRRMSGPKEADEQKLKRLTRYLKGAPRVIQTYPFEDPHKELTLYVDSNFSGCFRTRKSTSGGVGCWGSGVIKSWSKTQATIALSSGEGRACSCRQRRCGRTWAQSCPCRLWRRRGPAHVL